MRRSRNAPSASAARTSGNTVAAVSKMVPSCSVHALTDRARTWQETTKLVGSDLTKPDICRGDREKASLGRIIALPPYSPELNPVERIWHYLRSHWLANSVFRGLADIMDACEMAWNRFATNNGLVRSLCAVAWAPASSAL